MTGRRGWPALVTLAALVAGLTPTVTPAGAVGLLPECTRSWTTATGGDWTDPTRWSGGVVPLPTDHVCIPLAGGYTVRLAGGTTTVASLRIGTSANTDDRATLAIAPAGPGATHLLATVGIEVAASGALDVGAPLVTGEVTGTGTIVEVGAGAELINRGPVSLGAGPNVPATLRGAVVVDHTFEAARPFAVEGDLRVDSILELTGDVAVSGTVWARDGILKGQGALVTASRARIGALRGDGSIFGNGSIRLLDGAEVSFESSGSILVTVEGAVDVTTDVQRNNEVYVQPAASLHFTGTWTNRGRIWLTSADLVGTGADPTFVNDGTLQPSGATIDAATVENRDEVLQTGDLTVTGDLVNEGLWAILGEQLGVGGDADLRAPGTIEHSVDDDADVDVPLTVDGAATLDGNLQTDTVVGSPDVGTTFRVMDAGSRAGTFRSHELNGNRAYDIAYMATTVDITARERESRTYDLVRAAFQDLLGRQPTSTELADRVDAIEDGELSRGSLVRQLVRHPEHLVSVVDAIYVAALGHHAEVAGRDFWVEQLRTGRRSVADVTASINASPEARTRAGGTDAAWIDALFGRFLDRDAAPGERGYWVGRIAARGRTRVALELFQSAESRGQRITRIYRATLRRPASRSDISYWSPRLAAEGDLLVIAYVASSIEYANRAEWRYP